MAFLRIRKSIKIAPGVKLNLNKKSASLSVGPKGAHYTVSSNGSRTKTVGLPGSGVSMVDRQGPHHGQPAHAKHAPVGHDAPAAIVTTSSPVPEVSFETLATKAGGDVPKTLADRDRLIAKRPEAWEYRLLAAELFLGVQALEPMWQGYLDQKGAGQHHALSPVEAINFLRDRFHEGGVATAPVNQMGDPQLQEQAFGKSGDAGDPVGIQMLARLVTKPYEGLLRMAASARAQDVPRVRRCVRAVRPVDRLSNSANPEIRVRLRQ